jgi:hypothetical protein
LTETFFYATLISAKRGTLKIEQRRILMSLEERRGRKKKEPDPKREQDKKLLNLRRRISARNLYTLLTLAYLTADDLSIKTGISSAALNKTIRGQTITLSFLGLEAISKAFSFKASDGADLSGYAGFFLDVYNAFFVPVETAKKRSKEEMLEDMYAVLPPLRLELLAIGVPLLMENRSPSGLLAEGEDELISPAFQAAADILADPSFNYVYRSGFFKDFYKGSRKVYRHINLDETIAAMMKKMLGERLFQIVGLKGLFDSRKVEMETVRMFVNKYNELEPGEDGDSTRYPDWPIPIYFNSSALFFNASLPRNFRLGPLEGHWPNRTPSTDSPKDLPPTEPE